MQSFSDLASALTGLAFERDTDGFTEEVAGHNTAVVHSPDLVVGAATIADVQHAVRYAREHKLSVNIISTGHAAQHPITGGLVITTRRLNNVAVDATSGIATVGAGVTAGALTEAAGELGLAPVAGSSPTVGVVGLVLGAGIGPLARSHGYSSDHVRRFTVVTGTGEISEASADENPELFWALRGGSSGLGVVVEMDLQLARIPELYGGFVSFAEQDIETVVRGWRDWTLTAPDAATTSVAIMHFPNMPFMPEPIRGKTLLNLRFAYPGSEAEGKEIAAPLLALATPAMGELGVLPAHLTTQIHNEPVNPAPSWSDGTLLSSFDDEALNAFLTETKSASTSPFLLAELRHLGAATRRDVEGGSAAGGRMANYSLYVVATNPGYFPGQAPAAYARIVERLAGSLAPETLINWLSGRNPGEFARAWNADTAERLTQIRNAVDPDGILALELPAPVKA